VPGLRRPETRTGAYLTTRLEPPETGGRSSRWTACARRSGEMLALKPPHLATTEIAATAGPWRLPRCAARLGPVSGAHAALSDALAGRLNL